MTGPDCIEISRTLASRGLPLFRGYTDLALVYLFGSTARGTARADSDVDLGLVFRKRGVSARDCYRLIGDLISRLEGITSPRPVDIVVLEEQGPIFCHQVLVEGRLLYEADPDRRVDFESEVIIRALDFQPTYELATRGRLEGLKLWLEGIKK